MKSKKKEKKRKVKAGCDYAPPLLPQLAHYLTLAAVAPDVHGHAARLQGG